MTQTPAEQIYSYLSEQGGQAEVPFHNLLTSWDVTEGTAVRRAAIEQSLREQGVSVEPPLADVGENDVVLLFLDEAASGPVAGRAAPPWADAASPVASDGPTGKRGRGRLAAGLAVFLILAAGAAGGGYALGKSGGEDLDAARAKGAAEGQREGAARGAERGYDFGLKQGEKAGYKQTYKKSYDRAYKRELKKAGLTPAQVSSK